MAKKKQKQQSSKPTTDHTKKVGKLSLIVPCYNEQKRIPKLVKTLENFHLKWGGPYEVVLVDDGSSDDTSGSLATHLAKSKLPEGTYHIHTLPKNIGKGGALQAGVAAATGDYLLTLDADMATQPLELKNWLRQLPKKKFDPETILIGSRENESSKVKGELLRRVAGLIFNFIIQVFTNLPFADTQCGFKLYPAAIGKELFAKLGSKGWAHDVEILYRASLQGVNIQTMPIAWEHQQDSKISLFRDSIRMFWDTMMIGLRLNWDWMVAQPVRDLQARSYNAKDPSFYRLFFVLLMLGLMIGMPMLSSDYGITGDEHLQKEYGEKVLAYFQTDGENQEALSYKNLYYYGGLFDYLTAWSHQFFPSRDIYEWRHMLNAFVGFLMIFFTGLLGKELGKSWRLAFFAALFLALSPRIFGHSMNNPKDIPFAAAYAFSILYLLRYFFQMPRAATKTMLGLILGIAAAINIRVGGILLIAYLGMLPLLRYILPLQGTKAFDNFSQFFRFGLKVLAVALLGYWGGLQFWPYGLEGPLTNPPAALKEMSNFSTSIRMLFEGDHLWSDELPWYYIPKWFVIGMPLFLLSGLGILLTALAVQWRKMPVFPILVLLFMAVFPVAYAVLKGASLYDGMRHFLFIFPVLTVLAAYGWHHLLSMEGSPALTWGSRGTLTVLLILPALWMWRNHPHQYVYFNELSGGAKKAFAHYEMDYWMNSIKPMADWLVENGEKRADGTLRVATNCSRPLGHYLRKALGKDAKVYYARYHHRHQHPADYYVFIPRFIDYQFLEKEVWPPPNVVYQESVDGIAVGTISKRSSLADYEAHEAMKSGDYGRALQLFEQAVQENEKNDGAWLEMADAAMRSNNPAKAKLATDRLVGLSDTYVNGLFSQASYLYNIKDFKQAQAVFERITQLNYKFNSSYYYLATIYASDGKLDQAIDMMEHYDKENGNQDRAFEFAVNICKNAKLKNKEIYFQSKLAYVKKDGQKSLELLRKSLALDPDYEPAKRLDEIFKRVIEKQKQK